MAKMTEIKLKYPMERARALCSVLAKKDTTLEVELNEFVLFLELTILETIFKCFCEGTSFDGKIFKKHLCFLRI